MYNKKALEEREREDAVRTVARDGDPDRYASALFAPRPAREPLFALYALNVELARAAFAEVPGAEVRRDDHAYTVDSLRAEGFDGDVTVVTREAHAPYQRPPLSKGYLAGAEGLDAVIVHPEEWYADNAIDLRTSTEATHLDPEAHTVTLGGGENASDTAETLDCTSAAPAATSTRDSRSRSMRTVRVT